MPHPIPKILARKGIKRTTDNIQPGQFVAVEPGLIFAFFGDEARAELVQRLEQDQCKGAEK